MRKLLLTFTALVTIVTSAPVYAQENCRPIADVVAYIRTIDTNVQAVVLGPAQAARVLAWYNAQPPESEYSFDTLVVFRSERLGVGLGLGNGGMLCTLQGVPQQMHRDLFEAIEGGRRS